MTHYLHHSANSSATANLSSSIKAFNSAMKIEIAARSSAENFPVLSSPHFALSDRKVFLILKLFAGYWLPAFYDKDYIFLFAP